MNFRSKKRSMREKKRRKEKKIVLTSANYLLDQSIELRNKNPNLAQSYYHSAKKIGMRTRTHLQKEKKLLFCPHCGSPYSSSSVRIRINSRKKQINYYCKNCNKMKKKGY